MEGALSIFDQLGQRPPAAELLDWQFVDFDETENRIRVSFDGHQRFTNPSGFLQGGFLCAMLDEAMGCVITASTNAALFTTTISMSIDFVRPARPGRIFGEGRITSMGKTVAFIEGKLFDEQDRLLARSTASSKLVPLDPSWIRPSRA